MATTESIVQSGTDAQHEPPTNPDARGHAGIFWWSLLTALIFLLGIAAALVASKWVALPAVFGWTIDASEASVIALHSVFLASVFLFIIIVAVHSPAVEIRQPEPQLGTPPKGATGDGLKAKHILSLAFSYAQETAAQAMEHRLTIVNFYLLIVGGVISAIAAIYAIRGSHVELLIGAVALLWLAFMIGWLTLLKLVRLRAAWIESATEMHHIRAFYILNVTDMSSDALASAFVFTPKAMPKPYRRWNVFHLSAILIALLDSSAFLGAFVIFALAIHANLVGINLGLAMALISLFFHMWVYDFMLRPDR